MIITAWGLRNLFFYLPFYCHCKIPFLWNPPPQISTNHIYGAYDVSHFYTAVESFYNPLSPIYQSIRIHPLLTSVKLPLYPIISDLFSIVSGIPVYISFVIVNNLSSLLIAILIFKYLEKFNVNIAIRLISSILLLVFPARWAMYQLIPSADMLSSLLILSFITYYDRKFIAGLSLFLFIWTRPNSVMIIVGLLTVTLLKYFYTDIYIHWKNKSHLKLVPSSSAKLLSFHLLIATLSFLTLYSFYSFRYTDGLVFLRNNIPGQVAKADKVLFPMMEFYGLGSDNLTWNLFLIIFGLTFMIKNKQILPSALALTLLLPTFVYTTDTVRYAHQVYPLLISPIFATLISAYQVKSTNIKKVFLTLIIIIPLSIINAKYFWVTVSAPGYQDPNFPAIKRLVDNH